MSENGTCLILEAENAELRNKLETVEQELNNLRASIGAIHCRTLYGKSPTLALWSIRAECEFQIPELKQLRNSNG